MITIASSILFLSFYTLYYTSKRVPLSYNISFEKWMQNNPNPTKITGIILLIVSYILWLYIASLGSGTLAFIVELMTISSLIVILKPLNIINYKSVILTIFIIGCCEMYYS